MKKTTGIFIALVAAAAGAAGTIFALKRKKELDKYAYDDFDEEFFDSDDEDEEDEIEDEEDDYEYQESTPSENMPSEDKSEEENLDTIEEEIQDNDQPRNIDF